jgi:hypothetical protein
MTKAVWLAGTRIMVKLEKPVLYLDELYVAPAGRRLDTHFAFRITLRSASAQRRPVLHLNAWMATNRSLKGQDLNLVQLTDAVATTCRGH